MIVASVVSLFTVLRRFDVCLTNIVRSPYATVLSSIILMSQNLFATNAGPSLAELSAPTWVIEICGIRADCGREFL
jgi:hypothetical protein